jgi:tetratricopeptide (TPR) repeat protein
VTTTGLILEAALAVLLAQMVLRLVVVYVLHTLIFRQGSWSRAEQWLRWFGWFLRPWYRRTMKLVIAEFSGRTADALAGAPPLLADTDHPLALNQCINIFINAGRYERALEVESSCPAPSSRYEHDLVALLQVNLAEAEYNLGRWEQAAARLSRLDLGATHMRISSAGARQQTAWILAHLGRATDARVAIGKVPPRDLPRIFHAEYHFTLAWVALAERDTAAALACAEEGLALARRAGSHRNGLYLRARILSEQGDADAALADFARAAALPYRGQGGDGLLAWGDLLRSLGREDEARRAYALARERDPESESAREAGERLAAGTRGSAAVIARSAIVEKATKQSDTLTGLTDD